MKKFISLVIILCASYTLAQRLIPFEHSTDDAYVISIGDKFMRFFRNGGLIFTQSPITSAEYPYLIATDFNTTEIWTIQYTQTDNSMYLVDGTDPPQVLTRADHDDWTIADVNFEDGPFLPENEDTDISITPSAITGSITLESNGSDTFSATSGASHVGSLWQINQRRANSVLQGELHGNGSSDENSTWFKGDYSFRTQGTWDAVITLERSTDDGDNWTSALVPLTNTNFDNPEETEEDGAIYRVTMSGISSGHAHYTFTITDEYNHGIVRITAVTDANTATGTVLTRLVDTNSTNKWAEGYWSDFRGWPLTVVFHQQRLIYAGSKSYPQTIWFGTADPDSYTDFTEGADDTDAFTIALQGQNPIRWLLSDEYLLIGTSGSCGRYGDEGQAITPTSPNYREQTRHGSAIIGAVLAGDAVLYVERGERKVREFSYNLQYDKFLSPDLNILSSEIISDDIKDIAFQLRPDPTLWCILDDGNIATLTYQRDQSVVAWTKQITDGDFESVAVISGRSGTNEDQVWVLVKRTIDDTDYRYIEQFQPRNWGSDINDCWFVDSGITYTGTATTAFSGADHLEGETVSVYADTLIESTEVVASGNVTIDNAASRVLMGMPFTSKLETLPLAIDPQDKTYNKTISRLSFDLYNTGYLQFGNGANATLTNINFENSLIADANATAQGLYTSIVSFKDCTWQYGSMKKQTIYLESAQPMPLTVRSITPVFMMYQ